MRAFGQAVLDWIVMDIVEMLTEIMLVSNRMFPEAPLPNIAFPMGQS